MSQTWGCRPGGGRSGTQDSSSRVVPIVSTRTDRWRGVAERERASRRLDAMGYASTSERRKPSTFGLSRRELQVERSTLLSTGGVEDRPPAPWYRGEVDVVLNVEGAET